MFAATNQGRWFLSVFGYQSSRLLVRDRKSIGSRGLKQASARSCTDVDRRLDYGESNDQF